MGTPPSSLFQACKNELTQHTKTPYKNAIIMMKYFLSLHASHRLLACIFFLPIFFFVKLNLIDQLLINVVHLFVYICMCVHPQCDAWEINVYNLQKKSNVPYVLKSLILIIIIIVIILL